MARAGAALPTPADLAHLSQSVRRAEWLIAETSATVGVRTFFRTPLFGIKDGNQPFWPRNYNL